jgi:hypothetical protein
MKTKILLENNLLEYLFFLCIILLNTVIPEIYTRKNVSEIRKN